VSDEKYRGKKKKGKDTPYEPEGDDMVCDELLEILARLLKTKYEYDELLAPVRCLHEIVAFQFRCHLPVRVT
jgi:hypothetical protein